MPLSLIVGVRNHSEIFLLLDSVDANVEVIVVLNNSCESLVRRADSFRPNGFRLRWLTLNDSRLGAIKNFGIRAASHDLVFLLDADCQLSPGALNRVVERSQQTNLGKVNMVIRHATFGQRIRAVNRIPANPTSAYTPGLFFNRRILPQIGGYFYRDDLPWREDYELNQRLRRRNLPVTYCPEIVVDHPPYHLWRDLRTAFRCGRGQRVGCSTGTIQPSWKWGGGRTRLGALRREPQRLALLSTTYLGNDAMTYGLCAAIYKLIWKLVFTIGYYFSRADVA